MRTLRTVLMLSIIGSFFLFCERNKNPLQYAATGPLRIEFHGKTKEHGTAFFKFRVVNDSGSSVWFWGYDDDFPIYLVQVKSDTGWVNCGGWCGTGLALREFPSHSSIDIKVPPPQNAAMWRVGISFYGENGQSEQRVWSISVGG